MKKDKVTKIDEYCRRKGFLHRSEMTPDIYFAQNLVKNVVSQFGTEVLEFVLVHLNLIPQDAITKHLKDTQKRHKKVS